jgi:16S rRNA (cytosine1402-N4)-methyltransferase
MNTKVALFKDFVRKRFDNTTCWDYLLCTKRAKKLYTPCTQLLNSHSSEHISVLPQEIITYLDPQKGQTVVDCTLGLGGHALQILKEIGPTGLYIGIDQDKDNLSKAKKRLEGHKNVYYVHDNFEYLEEIIEDVAKREGKPLSVDKILFDLGLSSVHIDNPERGFSFQADGPLDMRFDKRQKMTAWDLINNSPERTLVSIFRKYGEEPHSKGLARKIVQRRKEAPINTTNELAEIIGNAVHSRGLKQQARIFQALRIVVNRELEVFESALEQAINILVPGGRVAVISFHSLEDRIAKTTFRTYSKRDDHPKLSVLTKKPLAPTEEEIRKNPRSRSAKLRVAQRIT